MTTTNGIIQALERKPAIATARPGRHTTLRRAAEGLSRRNADQAVCELLNEALQACVALCYEKDSDGTPSNVDAVTARVLVPLPWGRAGHRRWGLRPQEANILRAILQARQAHDGLFVYDGSRRAWLVNVAAYPTLRKAAAYLDAYPVGVGEYREARSRHLGNR